LAILGSAAKDAPTTAAAYFSQGTVEIAQRGSWDIERQKGSPARSFDQEFIKLARSVYINNGKRGNLKQQIDALLSSDFAEQKQYTSYSN
jgi:hypothetical protein